MAHVKKLFKREGGGQKVFGRHFGTILRKSSKTKKHLKDRGS